MNLGLFALKNLGRHPSRTAFKVGGIALITAIMLVWGCINAGLEDLLEKAATHLDVGEFELYAAGYARNPDLYKVLKDVGRWESLLNQGGFHTSPRLYGFGLAATGALSVGVQMRGIDPAKEGLVTELDRHIEAGAWLEPAQPKGVVIGKQLAHRLRLKLGDELVMIAQAADGSMANALFKIVGILAPISKDIDSHSVFIQAEAFRAFFRVETGIHELAISRQDSSEPFAVAKARLNLLVRTGPPGADLRTWRQLKPMIAKALDVLAITSNFVFAFIYLSLGGLIVNMVFMSIYERLHEFGTMKALGMTPWQVVTMVVAESGWTAVLIATAAWAIGIPVAWWFSVHGLDLSLLFDRWALVGFNLEPVIFARIGFSELLLPVGFMAASLIIFCLYPGIDAALMPPTKALSMR